MVAGASYTSVLKSVCACRYWQKMCYQLCSMGPTREPARLWILHACRWASPPEAGTSLSPD